MTITSLDGLVLGMIGSPVVIGKISDTAEVAGTPHTPWYRPGVIGAGAAPTNALNGATISYATGLAGAIPIPAAVTGTQIYLARATFTQAGSIGMVRIIDRQWGNVPVVTTTGAQAIVSPTWVARDASASTSGAGIQLALECSSITGNVGGITNTTVTYTNSAGATGRVATISYPATAFAGTFVPFSLVAGDSGVRSVQSITLGTSYVSGQVHLVAYRVIADIPTPTDNVSTGLDWAQLGLPAVWDSSVLQLVYYPTSTAVGALAGSLSFAQG